MGYGKAVIEEIKKQHPKEYKRIMEKIETDYKFGDKVMHRGVRAIFDMVNGHGDAIILEHPDDSKREYISHGHHDVDFKELKKGWVEKKK